LALVKNDRLVVSLTRRNEWNKPLEGVECVTGREALHSFLSDDAPSDATYYLCGPPSMLDDALDMLQQKGISSERIAHEKWW
jgi:Na+-transporting NADH:ubiquinone oxidoreductase subunit NqrF